MKEFLLTLVVALIVLIPLVVLTNLNGIVAGAISVFIATLAGNWYSYSQIEKQDDQ